MIVCPTIADIRRELSRHRGQTVGFVPTMGYLHQGHLSLVRASKQENDLTVASIFVNPAQFGPAEDFQRYPRDLERDSTLLEKEGVDLLFHPEASEIYPAGFATYVLVERLSTLLCGRTRPGHFRGVATVVLKLFNIVGPTHAYFGQKDAQQAIIICRLVHDLDLEVKIRVLPIVRDSDGLALSSRNVYLSKEERAAALHLPQALHIAGELIRQGESVTQTLHAAINAHLQRSSLLRIDYVAIVGLSDLTEIERIEPRGTLIACAIYAGKTRLIDNMIMGDISC